MTTMATRVARVRRWAKDQGLTVIKRGDAYSVFPITGGRIARGFEGCHELDDVEAALDPAQQAIKAVELYVDDPVARRTATELVNVAEALVTVGGLASGTRAATEVEEFCQRMLRACYQIDPDIEPRNVLQL